MVVAIDPRLLALAGAGLPASRPLIRDGWDVRLDEVFGHGLAGFLAWAHARGLLDLGDESVHRLQLRLESEAIRAVQLEGELIRLEPVLADLPAVVLKGAVLAHSVYPDPVLRPFTDLDLLVASRSHGDAIAALEALGYERSRPEPAPGYDARVAKALTLTHPGGVVVDLHRTLVAGRLGDLIDVDELLAGRQPVVLGGVPIPGPSLDAHLIESALHAVVGDGLTRCLSIRDVAQVALHPELDAAHAVDLAHRWQATDPVAQALHAVVDSFGLELPTPLMILADRRPVMTPGVPSPVRSARSRLEELRHGGLRRRITLSRALVAPSPAFLRWSYGDHPSPRLYGRRWLTLYRRANEARSHRPYDARDPVISPAPGPAPTPGEHDAPVQRTSTSPDDVLATLADRPPETARPTVVARSRLPIVAAAVPPNRHDTGETGAGGRSHPRQKHWSDARPQRAGRSGGSGNGAGPPFDGSADAAGPDDRSAGPRADRVVLSDVPSPTGVRYFIAGSGLLVVTAICAQLGAESIGMVLVPLAAVLFSLAAARRISRRRPDEAWVGRWLVLGVAAKLSASYLRYLTLVIGYEGNGDATGYDTFGRQFARAWMGNGIEPNLPDLRRTNFLRWFTGVVYYVFGSDMLLGFFVFGLLALIGSYLWYRATVDAVPFVNKRLYLGLVLFAPSIAFWPSSIGKESLMQLGIGAAALGTAFLLRQRLLAGLATGIAGGWLLWVVRPHLLALVTVATGCAYLAGRVRDRGPDVKFMVSRTVGLLAVAFLVVFTVSQGAEFLGMKDLSLTSVEQSLEEQQERTDQGGSQFDNGGNYLSPVNLPRGAVTVLLRPFPWETTSPFQLLASLESALLTVLIVVRLSSLRESLVRARSSPFLIYCWVLTILYAATFASFANFGLLVRQRSLVLPALFVLLSVSPALDRAHRRRESANSSHRSGPAPGARRAALASRANGPT